MPNPSDGDKRLLDRLKALSPSTTVSLSEHQATSPSRTLHDQSRGKTGTGLADRLRQLREQTESTPTQEASHSQQDGGQVQSQSSHSIARPRTSALPHQDGDRTTPPAPSTAPHSSAGLADYDELLQTDDGFLEDLLNEEAALGDQLPLDARAELDRLHELAQEFSRLTAAGNKEGERGEDDGDDSNGEEMAREIEDIFSKAVADSKSIPGVEQDEVNLKAAVDSEADAAGGGTNVAGSRDEGHPNLALPSVPTDLPSPTTSSSAPSTVPVTGNFEDDMARRMAALRSFRPSIGSAEVEEDSNPLGLPSVPTFKPSEGNKPKGGPSGRVGFTDDDMKTWCVACLEDGTLICPECDDEVYCSQCWFDMHKGPAAGFEERSHKALQFNKDRKKKKVAVGA